MSLQDRANALLPVETPFPLWAETNEVVLESARHAKFAASKYFRRWLAARLFHLRREDELRELDLPWRERLLPRAVAFPMAGHNGGTPNLGFVSARRDLRFPETNVDPSSAMFEACQQAIGWIGSRLNVNLPVRIWVPESADGTSVGLAGLLAGFVEVIWRWMRIDPLQATLLCATGVVDVEVEEIASVGSETVPPKLQVAVERGIRQVLVPTGQPGVPKSTARRTTQVGPKLRDALRDSVRLLVRGDRRLRAGYSSFNRLTNRLGFRLGQILEFLADVLAEVTEDRTEITDIESAVRARPPVDDEPPAGPLPEGASGVELWKIVVDRAKREKVVQLCHETLARHSNDRTRFNLAQMTMDVTHKLKERLPAQEALARTRVKLDEGEDWLSLLTIAGAVGPEGEEHRRYVWGLIDGDERNDHRTRALAVASARHLYLFREDRLNEVRALLTKVYGSTERPPDDDWLLGEFVDVRCRTDFDILYGEGTRSGWESQRRCDTVGFGVYPVTNVDYERFDPSHVRSGKAPDDDSPVVNVSWYDAYVFAFWAGLDLPTRLEWMSAAVPNEPHRAGAYIANASRITPRVATYQNSGRPPNGTTPVTAEGRLIADSQACEMSGNVWEWLQDWGKPWVEKLCVGGSWYSRKQYLKITYRNSQRLDCRSNDIGFRCVKLPQEGRAG